MRIPRWLRNQKVTVKPFKGQGAYGPVYGTEFVEWVRFEPSTRKIRDSKGEEVVTSGRGWFAPESPVKEGDLILWEGKEFEVILAIPQYGKYAKSHVEVSCKL